MHLYIHVPFCSAKCSYCAFYSIVPSLLSGSSRKNLFQDYTRAIIKELALYLPRLDSYSHNNGAVIGKDLKSIFFGGGTPSLLEAKEIASIIEAAAKIFSFSPKIEISLEANPESLLRPNWLKDIKSSGVNRMSVGVQSFDDKDLKHLGRMHSAADAKKALSWVKEEGFNLNIDLIWALPLHETGHETGYEAGPQSLCSGVTEKTRKKLVKDWLKNLETALSFSPEHLSTYALSLEENTPLLKEAGKYIFPGEETEIAIYLEGIEYLRSQGLEQYEISNFAKKGFQCIHNLGYWKAKDYLGLGPSAVSTVAGRRWHNIADFEVWKEFIKQGELKNREELLSSEDILHEKLMLSLRLAEGLNLAEWQELRGKDFLQEYKELAAALIKDNLAQVDSNFFKLSSKGMLLSDSIISSFF